MAALATNSLNVLMLQSLYKMSFEITIETSTKMFKSKCSKAYKNMSLWEKKSSAYAEEFIDIVKYYVGTN